MLPQTPPTGPTPFDQVAIRLHPTDNIAIAKAPLFAGTMLTALNGAADLMVAQFVPQGHKFALAEIVAQHPVYRYGQVIGFATQLIQPGAHVHTHNLAVSDLGLTYQIGTNVKEIAKAAQPDTFLGYARPGGRAGTRNTIAVISSVNCSAHVCRQIAAHFTPERLAAYPNVDAVIPITHSQGCAQRIGSEEYQLLQRTLAGIARHPNVGGALLIGLGCETNQPDALLRDQMLADGTLVTFAIQDEGGTRKTIAAGIAAVEAMLPQVNATGRTPQPVSDLLLALQCGGSDGWSGVTANPAVGLVSDRLVGQGGSTLLAETPEIYGAQHLLLQRAVSEAVGEKLIGMVQWWEAHTALHGMEIDNNPSVGNKAGGLTTIYEKSLGAVAKGGSAPLVAVYHYAEPVTTRGFAFMDSPGYDPVAVTGQVASGCNLVLFTTGRGSVFGFQPAPSIKICTNSETYRRMEDDMDLNAGRVLDGASLQEVADELYALVLAVASGQQTKSEAQGFGAEEFIPWKLSGTL